MASTFRREFDNAYKSVASHEKERARFIKSNGYDTYADMISEEELGNDPSMLQEAESDCYNTAAAYTKLAYLAKKMADALDRQGKKIGRAVSGMS